MKKYFLVLDSIFAKFCDLIVMISSLLVVGLVFFMVIARYVLEWSIIGLDEIALIGAMWLYMTGAIVASRRAEHLVVDFLPRQLTSSALLRFQQRFVSLVMICASVFFIFLALRMLGFAIRRPQTTPGLGIPELVALSAVALNSIASFSYALRDFITGKACHNIK